MIEKVEIENDRKKIEREMRESERRQRKKQIYRQFKEIRSVLRYLLNRERQKLNIKKIVKVDFDIFS